MDTSLFWSLVLTLSTICNRAAEAVKGALKIKFPSITEAQVSLATIITSVLIGIIGAFFLNLNPLVFFPPNPYTERVPERLVIFIFGAAVGGLGADLIHKLLDLLGAFKVRMEAPAAGGFTEKTERTFTAPAPEGGSASTIDTPGGSATVTPSAPVAPIDPLNSLRR